MIFDWIIQYEDKSTYKYALYKYQRIAILEERLKNYI